MKKQASISHHIIIPLKLLLSSEASKIQKVASQLYTRVVLEAMSSNFTPFTSEIKDHIFSGFIPAVKSAPVSIPTKKVQAFIICI